MREIADTAHSPTLIPVRARIETIETEHLFDFTSDVGSLDLVDFGRQQGRLPFGINL